ncbi:hypothetical protein [Streptomyces sp. NPDC085596]|uniref:hypothetical protein n=1 Tax=Streptomyces TaxID=1883 RepID=UPI0037D2C688
MRRRRTKAVEGWLLAAATLGEQRARKDWSDGGPALLRCGSRFAVASVPVALITFAASSMSVSAQDAYLARTLRGTPLIRSRDGREIHALLRPDALAHCDVPGTECLGRDHFLGVPRPDLVGYQRRAVPYWVVPMTRPGALGCIRPVAHMIARGRNRMTQQEGTS